MPYVRRTFRKRPYKARTSVRRGKPPVPKKRRSTRSYARSNALATRANSRRISALYNRQFGPVQRNLHLTGTNIIINATQPVCFDAADFTCQRTSTGGITTPGCVVWQVSNLLNSIATASLFVATGAVNNALWSPSQQDFPDGGRYKPLYAEYQIEVQGRNNIDDVWVQVDLFTQHHGFQRYELGAAGTSNTQRVMPNALINMGNMVDVNELNPSLFKRYQRKRVYLNSATQTATNASGDTTGTTSTTGNTKYIKFRVAPKKVRNQMFTSPDTPGVIEPPTNQTSSGDYSYLQVDPRTPFWCMISATDRTALDGDAIQVRIRRHVVWRDVNGGTLL